MFRGVDQPPMLRVDRERPCPVCGRPDWCLVAPDGSAALCARIDDGAVKRCGDAGWLHVLVDRQHFRPRPTSGPIAKPATSIRDWIAYYERVQAQASHRLQELASQLGVSRLSLERLEIGYDPARNWWVFPERDATGTVVGFLGRNRDGQKRRLPGSRCGLTYPSDWSTGDGPLLLVEGPSDLAAVLTLGLGGVGRPSNTGGVALLAELLLDLPRERRIVVIGEWDQKPDGQWPGRAGAISTATALAQSLERPIEWSLPPDHAKDTRAWLLQTAAVPAHRWADLFVSGLNPTTIDPPVCYRHQRSTARVVDLGAWRDTMLAARLASLSAPGYYLDASTTGAGKSHVDLAVVRQVLGEGCA